MSWSTQKTEPPGKSGRFKRHPTPFVQNSRARRYPVDFCNWPPRTKPRLQRALVAAEYTCLQVPVDVHVGGYALRQLNLEVIGTDAAQYVARVFYTARLVFHMVVSNVPDDLSVGLLVKGEAVAPAVLIKDVAIIEIVFDLPSLQDPVVAWIVRKVHLPVVRAGRLAGREVPVDQDQDLDVGEDLAQYRYSELAGLRRLCVAAAGNKERFAVRLPEHGVVDVCVKALLLPGGGFGLAFTVHQPFRADQPRQVVERRLENRLPVRPRLPHRLQPARSRTQIRGLPEVDHLAVGDEVVLQGSQ